MAASNAFPPLDTSIITRGASPTASSSNSGMNSGAVSPSMNGNGVGGGSNNANNYMSPLPVGHQQDLNFLYGQIQELSDILRANREKVNSITRTAEEVARRSNGVDGAVGNGNGNGNGVGGHEYEEGREREREADKARIRELERDLAKSNHIISLYKHEQTENTSLIAMYEDALGTATDQVRNYCGDIESRFLSQRKHYNALLQQEKDEHLASRLDRDHWHAQTLRLCEMIRTADKLRTDEWGQEYTIISGLQNEVRCLRRCLGMEVENPEDETGWPYLKDMLSKNQS